MECGVIFNWYRLSFGGDENVLKLYIGDGLIMLSILKFTEVCTSGVAGLSYRFSGI